ncbi:mediator of RNA polymerase II transcription subunit 8-like isoform X2 [Zingiber officinale]|uniref:mediator of RNA polymerase II transcription subunit 8-like isoform X2 n=1 Tax=Zingiber officinale TaxID=94328 RepID=UPI001C4ABF78|nr:mediator of RNA polymerase II transcription subunit 8-like isoform X2 [Zingiber officinale]
MDVGGAVAAAKGPVPSPAVEAVAPPHVERLNPVVEQQLHLESVKIRALALYKAVSHILEDLDAFARSNSTIKWRDALGQFSMVSMQLFNIVEDIKNVSKAFVIFPRNINAENATVLPVMLSSKLFPEMEAEDIAKREQLLYGISGHPVHIQIEKLKARIDMIGAACEAAETVISDCRKTYGLGSHPGSTLVPTLDKVQAAKIQEQENLLRAAVNLGEGLRIPFDQRQLPTSLPSHLADVLSFGDGAQNLADNSGSCEKNTPAFSSTREVLQTPGGQLIGRSVPSPSNATAFDNPSTPPMAYANSPRSDPNIMNTPSPQQQAQRQQQQRQKIMQLTHQQQLLLQQQLRQSSITGVLGQRSISQLHDITGQTQQKLQQIAGQHQMSYSHPMLQQQFQNGQLQTSHMSYNILQNQINQGGQHRNNINQLGSSSNALFSAAQASPNSQMISSMSASMQSQSRLPRMQFGLTGGHLQRNHPSQVFNDQMFGMSPSNPVNMLAMQQQQQGGFRNMSTNAHDLQPGMVNLPNTIQNPNFPQQQQNQQ